MSNINTADRKTRRLIRRGRHRFIKNLFIWFLGVIFIPTVLVATMAFVPLSLFVGNDGQVVSKEIAQDSLLQASVKIAGGLSSYGVSDFPVIVNSLDDLLKTKVSDDVKVGDLISIDKDALNAIKFNGDAIDKITKTVTVTATLKKVGGVEMLGDFGELSVFTEWDAVEKTATQVKNEENKPDKWYKMYYYQSAGEYVRAFDDNGNVVSGVTDATVLYYPALEDVVITDLVDIIGESIGRVKVSNLLEIFGAANETIINILGADTRVTDLSDFDINTVKLNVVIEDDGGDLYKVLSDATGKAAADITIGDLQGLDVDNIKLTTVISEEEGADLYDILLDLLEDKDDADDILIGDLADGGLDLNNLKLNAIIAENSDSEQLYDILRSALNKAEDYDVTVGDLRDNEFDIDNIKLEKVLTKKTEGDDGYEENKKLWDVLEQAITHEGDDITVGDLVNGFDLDNVNLNLVVEEITDPLDPEYDNNRKFWKILKQAAGVPDEDVLTVGALSNGFDINNVLLEDVIKKDNGSEENNKLWEIIEAAVIPADPVKGITLDDLNYGFDIDNIKLSSVLDEDTNAKLFEVLRDVLDKGPEEDIVISDLNGNAFDIGKLHLSSVLSAPQTGVANYEQKLANYEKLVELIEQAVGGEYTDITVADLSTGFDVNEILLDSVISADAAGDNKIICAILGKGYKVGEIGTALNNLAVTDVFEIECFTTSAAKAADTSVKYKKTGNNYTFNGSGTYYISKNAKIWLFMLYNSNNDIGEGVKGAYNANNLKLKDLDAEMGNMTDKVLNATIRQLWMSGILPTANNYSSIYTQTMLEVINAMALLP